MPNVEAAAPFRGSSVSKIFYAIAVRRLSVEADAVWAGRFAQHYLSSLYLSPCAGADGSPADLRLIISTAAAPPPLPAGLQQFDVPGGVCHADGHRYFLDVCGSRVAVAAPESRLVSVWFGTDASTASGERALITVMVYALHAALRRLGLYDLHAAAAVEPESGAGFVFPGTSGSGKTSLSIRLAAAGWRYLSDDMLAVSECVEGVEMFPLRQPFQTDAAALAGCELPRLEEALGVRIQNDPDKRKLNPRILFPGRFVPRALPRVLCFPSVAGEGRSRVEPLGQAEAMTRLIRMCPWARYDAAAAPAHLRLLARLARQCKTYALDAGRDIFDDPASAARLLAPLA